MKIGLLTLTAIVASTTFTNAAAHAPELHQKEGAEKPQCEALQDMDRSKMDAKDPIMQAMLKQCEDWLHDAHEENENDRENDKGKDQPAPSGQHHG